MASTTVHHGERRVDSGPAIPSIPRRCSSCDNLMAEAQAGDTCARCLEALETAKVREGLRALGRDARRERLTELHNLAAAELADARRHLARDPIPAVAWRLGRRVFLYEAMIGTLLEELEALRAS